MKQVEGTFSNSAKPVEHQTISPVWEMEGFLFDFKKIRDNPNIIIFENNAEGERIHSETDCREVVQEEEVILPVPPQYNLQYSGWLALYYPNFNPHFPELLLEVNRHQKKQSQKGKYLKLMLGATCQMQGATTLDPKRSPPLSTTIGTPSGNSASVRI